MPVIALKVALLTMAASAAAAEGGGLRGDRGLPPWGQTRGNAGRSAFIPYPGPATLSLPLGFSYYQVAGLALPCDWTGTIPLRVDSYNQLGNRFVMPHCNARVYKGPCELRLCSMAPRSTSSFSYPVSGTINAFAITPDYTSVMLFNATPTNYTLTTFDSPLGPWSVPLPPGVDPASDVFPVLGSLLLKQAGGQGYTLVDAAAGGVFAWTSSPPLTSFSLSPPTPPVLDLATGRLQLLAGSQLLTIALSSGLTSARSIGWYYPVTGEAVGQSLHAQPVQLTPTSLVAADGTLYAAMHEAVTNASWMVSIDPSCTSSNTSGGPACAGVPLAFVNQSLSELACGGGACAGLLSPSGDLVIANTGASFPQGLSLRYRVPLGAYARGFVSPVMAGGGAGGGASTVYAASVSGDLFAVDAATGMVTARAQLSANWAQWPSDSPLPRPTQVTVQELALGGSALLVSAQDSNLQTGAILVGFPASASPAPPAPAPAAKAPATLTPSGAAGLGVGLTLAACAALALALQWRGCIQVSLGSGKGGEQRLPLINFTSK